VASSKEQGPSGSNREADEDGGSGALALPLRCALVDGLEFFFLMVSCYFRVDEEEGRNHQTQQKSQERNRVGFFSIASKENIIYLHLI
jgi:hypothetical protein